MAATLFVEVRDQSGAWLPDVTLTLTDQQTALMREGTTSSSGLLVIPLLTAGTYTLQAGREGFKTEIVRDIADEWLPRLYPVGREEWEENFAQIGVLWAI